MNKILISEEQIAQIFNFKMQPLHQRGDEYAKTFLETYHELYSSRTKNCDKCDGQAGSEKTYRNQACIPIKGRVRAIDWCIHQIVSALNASGIDTVACCCGHGKTLGRIDLEDGRILWIEGAKK